MVGTFLGTDVPAVGISLGFERLVDLVADVDVDDSQSVAVLYEPTLSVDELVAVKKDLMAEGLRVRLVPKTKNTRAVLEQLDRDGFTRYAFLNQGEPLEWKTLT
jgi:histidyl-tRNA synthetase